MVVFEGWGEWDVRSYAALGIRRHSPPCFLLGIHLPVPHSNLIKPCVKYVSEERIQEITII